MKSIILILFCVCQIHGQQLKKFEKSVSKDRTKSPDDKKRTERYDDNKKDAASGSSDDNISAYTANLAASLIMDMLEPVIDTAVTRSIYFLARIPAPDIGRYPYAGKVPFNDAASSIKVLTHGIISARYQYVLNGVKSWRGEVRTGANGGYFQFDVQSFREHTIYNTRDNLTKIGCQIGMLKRIPKSYLTWEIFTGISGLQKKNRDSWEDSLAWV